MKTSAKYFGLAFGP